MVNYGQNIITSKRNKLNLDVGNNEKEKYNINIMNTENENNNDDLDEICDVDNSKLNNDDNMLTPYIYDDDDDFTPNYTEKNNNSLIDIFKDFKNGKISLNYLNAFKLLNYIEENENYEDNIFLIDKLQNFVDQSWDLIEKRIIVLFKIL